MPQDPVKAAGSPRKAPQASLAFRRQLRTDRLMRGLADDHVHNPLDHAPPLSLRKAIGVADQAHLRRTPLR